MSAQRKSTANDPRMPLTSADVLGERMEQLRELIPEPGLFTRKFF